MDPSHRGAPKVGSGWPLTLQHTLERFRTLCIPLCVHLRGLLPTQHQPAPFLLITPGPFPLLDPSEPPLLGHFFRALGPLPQPSLHWSYHKHWSRQHEGPKKQPSLPQTWPGHPPQPCQAWVPLEKEKSGHKGSRWPGALHEAWPRSGGVRIPA